VKRSTAIALVASSVAVPAIARAQSSIVLNGAGVPEESALPVLWGVKSGMFRAARLEVDFSAQRSGAAVTAGVVGGSYQFGKSSIVPLITAFAKQIPIKLIAPGGMYRSDRPHIALIVRSDSPIKTAADMNGKTLGVSSLNDLYTLGIKLWIDKNGGDSTTLKIVELPISAIEDALDTGRIDAGGTTEPQLKLSLDTGKERVLAYMFDAIAPQFMYTAWFASSAYVDSNAPALATFSRVERQAAAYVNSHPAETVDTFSAFTDIPAAVIAKMTRATMGTALDPKLLQPVIDMCVRYKAIPAGFDAADMIAPGMA
jgi:NitT/TauT family transport system substrate-binding protein